jgi:hypothetical protein
VNISYTGLGSFLPKQRDHIFCAIHIVVVYHIVINICANKIQSAVINFISFINVHSAHCSLVVRPLALKHTALTPFWGVYIHTF